MNRQLLIVFAAALVALLAVAGNRVYGSEEELAEIQKALEAKGNPWTAAMNPQSELPADVRKGLNGMLFPTESADDRIISDKPHFHPLAPDHWDWRNVGGANYVTPIRDQGQCGSCWDFAATGIVESGVLIYHDVPGRDYDLSEQHILSCYSYAGSCGGGYVSRALNYYRDTGSPDEPCFPYEADDSVPCADGCDDWASRAQQIDGWDYATYQDMDTETIKAAVYDYPVAAGFDVYTDFYYYSSGIYEYSWGSYEGGHAVVIVGWDDDSECWIVKNSWDTTWGESGFFRIKWGEVYFGYYSYEHYPSETMTYIDLDSFEAHARGRNVVLTWETGAEIDNAGFLIYRYDGNERKAISRLIEAEGSAAAGASYRFVDSNVRPGVTYQYWLVDIDTNGTWTAHGPVRARISLEPAGIRIRKTARDRLSPDATMTR